MSESHEPSYYEIALTNRQVVVAFVILLVCLIAAFFSGVWVGRENGYRAAEQMARNAPPPEEEKKEGQNLDELEFFGSDQKATAPEPAPAPESSTLAEDVGSTQAASTAKPPADTPPDASPAEDEEEPRPGRPAAEERQAQTQPQPQPQPQPDKPARTRPGREAPAAAESKRTAGQVVIQVFSSPEKDQAERIRGQLARGGQRAFLSPVEVAGRTMYRVRIGPFDSRDEAQKVAEQVRKGYKLDTWVTE